MKLEITLTIVAAAALLNIWLMMRCGKARMANNISVGDGGNEFLIRRMRAHANYAENTPIVLILIAVLELTGGTSTWLWAVGVIYIFGRIAHAFGMEGGSIEKARMVGTLITLAAQLGLAAMALIAVYSKLLG
ncbi:MAG: MAPEG family protein [Sphingomonadales bacterium]|nr:MAPEG family protein [Sphingomonadales bacterium]